MDLYTQGYKMIKQRATRAPGNALKREMTVLARTMFDGDKGQKELLKIIEELVKLESRIPGITVQYSKSMKEAVQRNDYTKDRPYEIRHQYNDANEVGFIYILTAPSRPNQCKIGATTKLSVSARSRKYESKYGYEVQPRFSMKTKAPFSLETEVKRKIKKHLVCGCTTGDSIEWYNMTPKKMERAVIKVVEGVSP